MHNNDFTSYLYQTPYTYVRYLYYYHTSHLIQLNYCAITTTTVPPTVLHLRS